MVRITKIMCPDEIYTLFYYLLWNWLAEKEDTILR